MSFQNVTAKVRPTKGIVSDIAAFEVGPDFYTHARNVMFRDGFPDRNFGEMEVYGTPLHPPSYLQPVITQSGAFWVYAGDQNVSVVTGMTHSDISFAGQSLVGLGNAWTGGLINNIVFLNNGLDAPVYWDGNPVNPMQDLPNWPAGTTCKAMRAFRFYLFAFDITGPGGAFENQLLWSDSAEPGTVPQDWLAAIDNDAGFVELSSTQGPIFDGGALRESMMLYKANSTWAADFVGGNNIFSFRKVFASSGILNRNCWTEWESNHVILTDSDVVLTDGFSVRSIVDKRIRQTINNSIDGDNLNNAFVAHYKAKNEVWVCIPEVTETECTLAFVWDYRNDTWTQRDIPRIVHANAGVIAPGVVDNSWDAALGNWNAQTRAWNDQGFSDRSDELLLAGYADTLLYQVDAANDFNGSNVNAVLRKELMPLEEPDRFKQVKRIWPKITGPDGTVVNIRVGSTDAVDMPATFGAAVPFVIGTDRFTNLFANGRYLSFEFSSNSSSGWNMTGFDIEYRLGSYF